MRVGGGEIVWPAPWNQIPYPDENQRFSLPYFRLEQLIYFPFQTSIVHGVYVWPQLIRNVLNLRKQLRRVVKLPLLMWRKKFLANRQNTQCQAKVKTCPSDHNGQNLYPFQTKPLKIHTLSDATYRNDSIQRPPWNKRLALNVLLISAPILISTPFYWSAPVLILKSTEVYIRNHALQKQWSSSGLLNYYVYVSA